MTPIRPPTIPARSCARSCETGCFLRWFNLLARPDALISDGEVISDVMAAYAARDSRPPQPAFGPTRDQLLVVLSAVEGGGSGPLA